MIQIHVDVDNVWMYEQEFGVKIHKDQEYIYTHSLPLFLEILKKSRSHATFMIIGKDLKLPACQAFCKKAIILGHEIANHTFSHPVSFGSLSLEEKREEIITAHELITKVCKKAPVGFRGSGYFQNKEAVSILHNLNYKYDASVLPGFAPFLMSVYASIRGGKNRHKTFGRMEQGFSPQEPYYIKGIGKSERLLELPISVLPGVKLPTHTTFAYFFGSWYRQLILNYLRNKPKYVLYLFHAIDFIDLGRTYPSHPVIPLRYSFNERLSFVKKVLEILVHVNGGGLRTSRELL